MDLGHVYCIQATAFRSYNKMPLRSRTWKNITPKAVSVSTLTYESGPHPHDDFPRTAEPVHILGRMYSTLHEMDELKDDILSRIWFTYRKNFPSIGSSSLTTDTGWGCMLRCGQMMLAQALCIRHLGRDWRWKPTQWDEKYMKLLRMFEDKKACIYSIHQIASMGESEGKAVGHWFGPNTIAQVLKRIAGYDEWSNLTIHVALDNSVIEDDIREECRSCTRQPSSSAAAVNGDGCEVSGSTMDEQRFSRFVNDAWTPGEGSVSPPQGNQSQGDTGLSSRGDWKPLLLIVPLRLGLTDINPIYFRALKNCLCLNQSVGIIGGKPNHAHWFIGFVGEELVYLDPHTTQPAGNLDDPHERDAVDETYHCPFPGRMRMTRLDPSVAVGFYCDTEKEFDSLCKSLRAFGKANKNSMFEIYKDRTAHFPYYGFETSPTSHQASALDAMVAEATGSSVDDEEFEII